ncbi:MAG: S1C family serine protease [Limisphaerales bacterium]
MKTIVIKDRLQVLLATGALTIGFISAGHASIPGGSQIESDAASTIGESDEASSRVEKPVIVKTGEADSDASAAKQERRVIVRTQGAGGAEDIDADEPGIKQEKIIIQTVGGDAQAESGAGKEVAWLGLSTEESSDALASQLGLQPGEGLLVTYVATNSPAAKASLQKNDLLVEMDGQKLVLPGQLRKLVQMRKEGDQVVLTYYHGGKKQDVTATLGKTKTGLGLFGDSGSLDSLKKLRVQLSNLSSRDGLNEHMKELRESLARAGVDRENIEVEVRCGLDQARKAIAEAVAQVHDARHGTDSASQAVEALARRLARSGVEVDKDATVTIKSRNDSVRTIVKSDDTGTYVIVANPQKRLTAHEKDGKLVFDGEIETSEQQEKVPKEVWKKVLPMIEQLNQAIEDAPAVEPAPKKTSALPTGERRLHSSHVMADLRTFAAIVQYLLEPEYPLPATLGTNHLALAPERIPIRG